MTSKNLYAVFSRQPDDLDFDAFSDWYEGHAQDNARTPSIHSVRRYAVETINTGKGVSAARTSIESAGPDLRFSHLAVYEYSGSIADVRSDLATRVASGDIALPDWFKDITFGSWACTPLGLDARHS